MLQVIARDMDAATITGELRDGPQRLAMRPQSGNTPASANGALRQIVGFDLMKLLAEFRAPRASVLCLWRQQGVCERAAEAVQEVARFNAGLDQAIAESLERYLTDASTLLAVVGHDLHSPLWVMHGSIEILDSPDSGTSQRTETMTRLRRAASSVERLVGDLLEYSSAQLGRNMDVHRARCDLRSVCSAAIDDIRAEYPGRQFKLSLAEGLWLQADAAHIEQVVLNLLHNAAQHGDPKAVDSLKGRAGPGEVVLEVANLGHPIPVEALHTIFDPAVSIPEARSEPHDHPYTSLGMAVFIVREILQQHDGTVTVNSDTATVFTVRLPHGTDGATRASRSPTSNVRRRSPTPSRRAADSSGAS